MIKFLRSLSPNNLPPNINLDDDLVVERERILQIILLVGCIVGLFVIGSNIPVVINNKSYGLLILYALLYSWLAIITIARRRFSYRVRAVGFLVIPFLLGFSGLLQYGLAGNGRLFLLANAILATTLLGVGPGSLVIFADIVSMIFAAVVRINANPLLSTNTANIEIGADWLSAIFVFILLSILNVNALQIIVLGLQRVAARQKNLAEELKTERSNLTEEVKRRTQQITIRADQLEAANQISQIIAQETDLARLSSEVVNRITERLDFYYAAIFFLDDRQEYAVMQAGTGEAGQTLLARNHSLKVGEIGMVGYVVSRGEIKVAQNVFLDPVHYKNPLLPNTKSEIAIPMIAGDQMIGALDVQSTELDAFTPETTKTLQTIADQLAIAVDRARLVERLQETLSQLDIGYRQFTQTAWKTFLKSTNESTAYRFRKGEGISVETTLGEAAETVLREKKQQTLTVSEIAPESGKAITALAIPVMLRNQILGVIDIRFDGDHISKDTLSLLESTSVRLAIALENARLLEESQSRANREHLVSDISARVRGSTEVSGILQTAALELGRVLGVSEVLVQLRSSTDE